MKKNSRILLRMLLLSSAVSLTTPMYLQANETEKAVADVVIEENETEKAVADVVIEENEAEKSVADAVIEEVITIGTRRKERTVGESMAPIDVFSAKALVSANYTDVNDALRTLSPSFNVQREATNDGSMLVRPFTLKNLPPDTVLLLLNGKRRHRSALVTFSGNYSTRGSQGSDFNQIPLIAMKNVQVLRDGAAAQYGSDAIAGVINITMKDASEGGSIIASYGQFYKGDGENVDLAGNIGLPLSDNGFLNLSAQYVRQKMTERAIQRADAAALTAAGYPDVPNPAIHWGNPDNESLKTAWNAGLQLNDQMEAYFFGNYSRSMVESGFWYRNPTNNSTFVNSIFDDSPEHPGIFDLTTIYPGGFSPTFGATVKDFSQVFGARGELDNGFTWDASYRYGRSDIGYKIKGTINASMGNASPTDFKPGSLAQRELQADFDVSYPIKNDVFFSDLLVAAGVEWKDEAYTIGAGDPASYTAGPLRDLPVGSNGFQGFGPNDAGTFSRDNYSAYIDFEADITEDWTVGIAGRYEDYSDFGSTTNYKVSNRYQITESFAVRGTISSGFRAPTAGQLYTQNVSTTFSSDDIPVQIDRGLFPTNGPVSQALGAEKLGPENSTNYSAGFVYSTDFGLSLTVDFYQIDITDRLLLAGPFDVTPEIRAVLFQLGVPNARFLDEVQYYQNQFETRTKGVDVVATYILSWDNGAATNIMLGWNYNDQRLTKYDPDKFSVGSKKDFESQTPSSKGNLTIVHSIDKFDFLVRGNYYGVAFEGKDSGNHLKFGPAILVDLELTYHVNENIDVSVNGRNVLNKYPGSYGGESWGMPYWSRNPYGFNGGYYSARVSYNF